MSTTLSNAARNPVKTGTKTIEHRELANSIRILAMEAVGAAKSGHPSMPIGMANVVTILFWDFLKFDPTAPDWPDRDRFVLSASHGAMLLHSLLYLTGYPKISLDVWKNFRQLGSTIGEHPEFGHLAGVEMTTGPLGQRLANAVGMAIAEQIFQRTVNSSGAIARSHLKVLIMRSRQ